MQRAIDRAIGDYLASGRTAEEFYDDWIWYSKFGYAFSSPDFFFMVRPVERAAAAGDRFEMRVFDNPDTWFIHECAGDMGRFPVFWRMAPFELPYAAWLRRDGELRVFDNQQLKGLIYGNAEHA